MHTGGGKAKNNSGDDYLFIAYFSLIFTFLFLGNWEVTFLMFICPLPYLLIYKISKLIKNKVLEFYNLYILVSLGFSPAFLFYYRDIYKDYGFEAVGNFNFELINFLYIYLHVLSGVLVTTLGVFTLNYILFKKKYDFSNKIQKNIILINIKDSHFVFMSIIFFILCAISFELKIGISGVDSPQYPYKIGGILYYLKMFIFPLMIFYVSLRVKINNYIKIILVFDAIAMAFFSYSKISMIFFLPIIIYLFKVKKRFSLVIWLSVILLFYFIFGELRSVEFSEDASYIQRLTEAYNFFYGLDLTKWSPLRMIYSLLYRLHDSQQLVLVYQFNLFNNIDYIYQFFVGSADDIGQIVAHEVFKIPLSSEGKINGVSIGFVAYMVLLSNKSFLIYSILSLFSSILIYIGDALFFLIGKYYSSNLIYIFMSFISVLILFNTIYVYYLLIIISIVLIVLLKLWSGNVK